MGEADFASDCNPLYQSKGRTQGSSIHLPQPNPRLDEGLLAGHKGRGEKKDEQGSSKCRKSKIDFQDEALAPGEAKGIDKDSSNHEEAATLKTTWCLPCANVLKKTASFAESKSVSFVKGRFF